MSSGVLRGGSGGSLGARFLERAFLFSLAFPFVPSRGRRGSSTRFSAFCLVLLQGNGLQRLCRQRGLDFFHELVCSRRDWHCSQISNRQLHQGCVAVISSFSKIIPLIVFTTNF